MSHPLSLFIETTPVVFSKQICLSLVEGVEIGPYGLI